MELEILKLNKEWASRVDEVRTETERVLTSNEMSEFTRRIKILKEELEDKNK